MQIVPINYWAVLVCGVVSLILGSLWYGPVFGKMWMKEMGWDPQRKPTEAQKKQMMRGYVLAFIGALVMAFVLDHALIFAQSYLKVGGNSAALQAGVWNWLGFIAPVTLGMVLWEGKSWKLWLLNNAYYLVQLLIFAFILVNWK